mmetsp:Transcript_16690/g.51277  ORF Transcript_16690/g.51277 Transcript_16690/m.51277 type:complete len:287 (+) Transcript_16690:2-862(+)
MEEALRRAASMEPSFIRFLSWAPEKPTARVAQASRDTSSSSGRPRACTRRMRLRPSLSGTSTRTWRSKRPGRRRAGSRVSLRLVAASTRIPSELLKPSISVRIWLSVCSRSSLPLLTPRPRLPPTASISSMNTTQGAFLRASWKSWRTRAAPRPTNISTNSEPEMDRNLASASPATERASRVLPVPGGPSSRQPRGSWAPRRVYLVGSLRKSTTSISSRLASSQPATSSKRVSGRSSTLYVLRLPPIMPPSGPPPPPMGPGMPPWPRRKSAEMIRGRPKKRKVGKR